MQHCVLGIETSCDETAVAIYDGKQGLLSHLVYTQVDMHRLYGGVVPELASRDHIQKITPLLQDMLAQANLDLSMLTGVAYTQGPGLMGALLVGALFGRTLAFALNIPAIGVHHLEGHLLAPLLSEPSLKCPFLALLVSGGHTQLISVAKLGQYISLGESLDDAAGEAFDKSARLLGIGYPGGAQLAKLAEKGNSQAFNFPRPMINRPGLDFSFSGFKTAVAQQIIGKKFTDQQLADLASSIQRAIVDTLTIKSQRALEKTGLKCLVVTGGVSANTSLRESLKKMTAQLGATVYFPELEFCTDNAAMIAFAGYHRLKAGQRETLEVKVNPRWKLEDLLPL
jgi:N6-L-threonylcarbamoyladenine synthase